MRSALAIAALWLAGCGTTWQPEAANYTTFPIEARFTRSVTEQLEVWLHRGQVLVTPGRALACRIDVQVRAGDEAEAQRLAAGIGVQLDEPPAGPTRLRARIGPNVPIGAAEIRFRLEVPRHVPLVVRTNDARVAVRDFDGELDVRTDTGPIDARIANGRIRLATRSGRIDLRGDYVAAELHSDDGEIDVVLPRAEHGPVDLAVATRSGTVLVEMVEDRSMQLEWSTATGRLKCEFPIEWRERNTLGADRNLVSRGVVNAGAAAPVRGALATQSGGVEVRRLPGTVASEPRSPLPRPRPR
jgi:hypothetical protein